MVLAQISTTSLEEAGRTFAAFVPKFLAFLVILIIGWIVAKVIAKAVDKVLERVGFDRVVERGGVKRALAKSQYDASSIVGKLVYYTLMLFVLQLAFGMWGPNPISDLIQGVIAFLPKLIVAIVIIVVAAAVAAAARELIDASLGGLSYGRMLGNLAAGLILFVGVTAALNQVEIAPEIVNGIFYAFLAVIAGSAIIAIGGGGIAPMRSRWETMLARYDQEKDNVRAELDSTSSEDLKTRAEQRKRQAQSTGRDTSPEDEDRTLHLPEDAPRGPAVH